MCGSQHMGAICSLMHIDVGREAGWAAGRQAGRQASPPPRPRRHPIPLFVPVLSSRPAQLTVPQTLSGD